MICTANSVGRAAQTLQARGWSRDRITLGNLTVRETRELFRRSVSRRDVGAEWSHNHGLRFRYYLDMPVSIQNMCILSEQAPDEITRKAAALQRGVSFYSKRNLLDDGPSEAAAAVALQSPSPNARSRQGSRLSRSSKGGSSAAGGKPTGAQRLQEFVLMKMPSLRLVNDEEEYVAEINPLVRWSMHVCRLSTRWLIDPCACTQTSGCQRSVTLDGRAAEQCAV